ncbi:MAG: excinuclease ABC subunit UvrA [Desulfobacterales bacterium]
MSENSIIIRGARQHNLKNIDIDIPKNRLVVVTGISGSGKSTLAFNTLYAEGQRRYVESLSTYARQFLERMEKPDVDLIEGLSPAIAIEQKTAAHNPRSTVGTVTEIYDYLRLLFARIGTLYCHVCDKPITTQTIDQIVDTVMSLSEGTRILILSPLNAEKDHTSKAVLNRLKKEGFARVRIDGEIMDIEDAGKMNKSRPHEIQIVIDRLVVKSTVKNRLADSLELAMSLADGIVLVDLPDRPSEDPMVFSEKAVCSLCQTAYPEMTPASFSFNSPQGACPKCDGMSAITEIDSDLIIPNPDLTLREGAAAPWSNRGTVHFYEFIESLTAHYGADIHTPYKEMPDAFKKALLYGSGNENITFSFERNNRRFTYQKSFEGIIPKLQRKYIETESPSAREEIRSYMNFRTCPECGGARLNRAARHVRVSGKTIAEITAMTIEKCIDFFAAPLLSGKQQQIAAPILKEVRERFGFLHNVGLSYLTMDRPAYTLSGGESQRIRLATQIGSKLTGVLYVLDEPSIGLHQRDNERLLATLKKMRDLDNTVLVVEHDEDTILSSDYVIDMGPGAGINGGHIVFAGTPKALLHEEDSLTGQYLSGRKYIRTPERRRRKNRGELRIIQASQNNLKHIDVGFPLGCFTCITGVSGSGKSSLVIETLYNALRQKIYGAGIRSGSHQDILGYEHVNHIVNIDQSPIGRTPRSNPGTYTGVFTFIRELFSKTPEARRRGYKAGRFSFNVKGGRCEACGGDGVIKIEMHFLPDIYVTCDVCRGKRYNRESLEVKYKGKTIADVLDMTVNQASRFFENLGNIRTKLQTLIDVGLGYIHLGQPATTLSGGEAQRVKLARELSKKGTGQTVYILDEPTTGLHIDDIKKLLDVLSRFVDAGNTVIVIEHNLDVIKFADHVIDLGPEGGDRGGYVVCTGTPEEISRHPSSYTGQFLKKVLSR